MSYFGQRLKIYFRCEREQLSNRLIMILESQARLQHPRAGTQSPGWCWGVPEAR